MKRALNGTGFGLCAVALLFTFTRSQAQQTSPQALVDRYCIGCHSEAMKAGGLVLAKLDAAKAAEHPDIWEKVIRKVRGGMMPPSGAARPERPQLDAFAATLEQAIDKTAKPLPGAPGLHRMNRTEYANAVRDLLTLDVDVATLLPADDSSEGFDNIADALAISPALVERYTAAAVKISKAAVGNPLIPPATMTYRPPSDYSQANHIDGQPLGTRGGMIVKHNFPLDAEYQFKIRVRGGGFGVGGESAFQAERMEFTLNGESVRVAPVGSLDVKLAVKAGPQTVGVSMLRQSPAGAGDIWQAIPAGAALTSIAITGPLNPTGPGETPSRARIFTCKPQFASEEATCATSILRKIATRAYRRQVTGSEMDKLLGFYQAGRNTGTFDAGIEQALARILVDPRFVFRFEREPANLAPGASFRISDDELAARLSFFLWSSIPDDALLASAASGKLHEPAELEKQTRRMLADPKANALVNSFGAQWLYLRELKSARPETRGFSENLRQAFRRETEMLLESILREDRSAVDLLNADYTFVDETLARHYGMTGIRGSRFRRVPVTNSARRGLLGQGSFLLVTSVATRTSPVARGKWILENILGVAAPLPPPAVPSLDEAESSKTPASVRQRMEQHRNNAVCSSCHKIMDPIGFALENFDLVGRWRTTDGGVPIDAAGKMVDGTDVNGPDSLRQALLARSDVFVRTLTEKLLTYGTGRALKYTDMPTVRAIDARAAKRDNKLSEIIVGVAMSEPFQMRQKSPATSVSNVTGAN